MNAEKAAAQQAKSPRVISLEQIDLRTIGHIASKGRVQDREYNHLPAVEQLIAQGKESVPYLISKLTDEAKVEGQVIDYWSDVRVADVALLVLTDFFTDSTWQRATVAGVSWDELLERGNQEGLTAEQVLRSYISKHGRKKIQDSWKDTWTKYRDKMFWDEKQRCFRLISS